MSDQYTIEVETADGEPMDIDAVVALLREHDIKAKMWAPGWRMTGVSAMRSAIEAAEMAVRMMRHAIGEGEDE